MGQLTDLLLSIREPDIGYAPDVSGTAFSAIPGDRSCFRGNLWYAQGLTRSQALQEVVASGASVVPELLVQLEDPRPSACEVELTGFTYLAQHLDSIEFDLPRATLFWQHAWASERRSYRLTLGDLCYVALGQIVNRNYCALYYHPSRITIINSPVLSPVVAGVARQQWQGVGRLSLCKSQSDDLSDLRIRDRRESAATRLMFYSPELGVYPVIGELFRPAYSEVRVKHFYQMLLESTSSSQGPAVAERLLEETDNTTLAGIWNELTWKMRAVPELQVYREVITSISTDRLLSLPMEPVSLSRQARLVERLHAFPSALLDEAVLKVLTLVVRSQRRRDADLKLLALSCARRLLDILSSAARLEGSAIRYS